MLTDLALLDIEDGPYPARARAGRQRGSIVNLTAGKLVVPTRCGNHIPVT